MSNKNNKAPKVIERSKLLLDQMVESSSNIEWVIDDPKRVAYDLWEAIRVSSRKEQYKKYSKLLDKYKISTIEPNIVKATIRENNTHTPIKVIKE